MSTKVSPEMFGMYVKATKQNGEDPPGMRMESSGNFRSQRDHGAEKEATCLAPALVFKSSPPPLLWLMI